MDIERKSLPKISRREFLYQTGLFALVAGCSTKKRIRTLERVVSAAEKIDPTPVSEVKPANEIQVEAWKEKTLSVIKPTPFSTSLPELVTPKPTETCRPTLTSTLEPTSVPTFTPGPNLEATRQAQIESWRKKGELGVAPEVVIREEAFRDNVYQKLAEMEIFPKDSFLLFGVDSPWLEKGVHPDQMDPSRFIALLGTKKDGEAKIYWFEENPNNQGEVMVKEGCGGVQLDSRFWGVNYKEFVVETEAGEGYRVLVGQNEETGQEEAYLFTQDALGITELLVPAKKNEKGDYIVDETRLEQEGKKQGYLIVAAQEGKAAYFMLTYSHLPDLPEGKARRKENIDTHLDIVNNILHVWNLQSGEEGGEKVSYFYFVGRFYLETGDWVGEPGWEDYTQLFESQPTPTPELTPEPTATPEATKNSQSSSTEVILDVPIEAQNLSLSCESSAAKMVAVYFKKTPPEGYDDWEQYFIKTIPRHCNPHRGYRGKIDGNLSISCEDPSGYGVYAEPLAEAMNKAGIPAQAKYGVDYNDVTEAIKNSKPVIVWLSGKKNAPVYETDPETGQKYVLLFGEHVWTVVGVREEEENRRFLVNEPWRGKQFWVMGFPRWDVFNGMRIVVG